MSWTEDDPGAGDMSAVESLAAALRTHEETVARCADGVDRATGVIATGWAGQAADAWVSRAQATGAHLRSIEPAVAVASGALMHYATIVREISARAAAASEDRFAAECAARRAGGTLSEQQRGLPDTWTVLSANQLMDTTTVQVARARATLRALVEQRISADAYLVSQLDQANLPSWDERGSLVAGMPAVALGGGLGWAAAFAAWAASLPNDDAGAAALRSAVADLDDAQFALLLAASPAVALLLMRPAADLSADARFAGVAAAMAGSVGLARVAAVRAAFAGMSAASVRAFARLFPGVVGNLDGAPYEARIAANRIAVTAALVAAREDQARTTTRIAELQSRALNQGPAPWDTTSPFPALQPAAGLLTENAHLADLTADISFYQRILTEQTLTMDDAGAHVPVVGHQVVLFDPAQGRFAELIGTLGPQTTNIGVFVPGTGANMEGFLKYHESGSSFVLDPIVRGHLAMITYLGGPMPQDVVKDAPFSHYALDRADGLRDFAAGIDRPADAKVTVLGHSYGGSVVGAAEHAGMVVDRVLHVESAGAGPGVGGTADYAAPNTPRYSMTAPGDPIGLSQGIHIDPLGLGHGADPDSLTGVVQLETGRLDNTDSNSPMLQGKDAHSDVFREDSTAWVNMRNVLTGRDVLLYRAPELHVGPHGSTWTEYPMQNSNYKPATEPVR